MSEKLANIIAEQARQHPAFSRIKRVAVAVVGGLVLLVGVALIVLPGPAFIVIPAGLAILAIEFERPRRWLQKVRSLLKRKKKK